MSEDANANPGPPGAGQPDDPLPPPEEFPEWIKDPANERVFEEHLRRVLAGELGELPPDVVEKARVALEAHKKGRAVRAVRDKFVALGELMKRPAGTMEADERLRQCNARMDELTDALLETPEPFRSQYLKQLLPIREKVRAMRVEED